LALFSLFSRAKQICSLDGAGLTNLLWCLPGTQVLELFANNYLNGVYKRIPLLNHLRYQYCVFSGDHKHKIFVPLHILATALDG
jgi:capsular polysaccharide biosynthesis protein